MVQPRSTGVKLCPWGCRMPALFSWGAGGEACARRWCLGRVFDCGLNIWGRATFVPKTGNEQRRHLRIGGLKRVSLLRFFARLKRNEVPPRTGANSKSQENTTYAERPREKKDSMLAPHSPRPAPRPHSPRAAPRPPHNGLTSSNSP